MRCYGNVRGGIYPCDQKTVEQSGCKCAVCKRPITGRRHGKRMNCCSRACAQKQEELDGTSTMGCAWVWRCIETGKEYETAALAGAAVGTGASNVARSCRQGTRTGGYHFEKYLVDKETGEVVGGKKEHRAVLCVESGVEYESALDAARGEDTTVARVYKACNSGYRADGKHYRYTT